MEETLSFIVWLSLQKKTIGNRQIEETGIR